MPDAGEGVPALLKQRRAAPTDMRLRASVAYGLSILASIAFVYSLPTFDSLTLENFGNIRVTYLNALFGAGHIYLFNLMAGTLL